MANFPGESRGAYWALGILILLLTLLSSANLYLLIQNGNGAGEVAETPRDPMAPVFVKVGPMTVNLGGDAYANRLLYAGLALRVENEETGEMLRVHMPELHSRLLLLLSAQSAEELTAPGGKEALAERIQALFQQPLAEGLPLPAVSGVLFTDFIVQ